MIEQKIEVGDRVKHRTIPTLNGGLIMSVVEIDKNSKQAKLAYFAPQDGEMIHKESWFPVSELEIIHKVEGGFND